MPEQGLPNNYCLSLPILEPASFQGYVSHLLSLYPPEDGCVDHSSAADAGSHSGIDWNCLRTSHDERMGMQFSLCWHYLNSRLWLNQYRMDATEWNKAMSNIAAIEVE